ncbi:MAG: DUF881 domain-containing protein [Clostridiales bacterium]|jgi:uncharacterized protein YlxW (UPF0749 family)|nr:DUF881 domain-containing protein [Clostridiales bacterium]
MEKILGLKITVARGAIAIICLIVGLVISLQIKSVVRNTQLDATSAQRVETLVADLIKEKDKNQGLFQQAMEYKSQLEQYQDMAAEQSDSAKLLAEQLRKAEISAGLADVEGPGVVFTMNDSKIKDSGENINAYLIHDQDLLLVINELRNAGAEALSLNGERLLATSYVRCVGSVVMVNGQPYAPPYVITAIGDPTQLETALQMPGGVVKALEFYGIEMALKKSDHLQVPRYSGVIDFKYAVPVSAADAPQGGSQ